MDILKNMSGPPSSSNQIPIPLYPASPLCDKENLKSTELPPYSPSTLQGHQSTQPGLPRQDLSPVQASSSPYQGFAAQPPPPAYSVSLSQQGPPGSYGHPSGQYGPLPTSPYGGPQVSYAPPQPFNTMPYQAQPYIPYPQAIPATTDLEQLKQLEYPIMVKCPVCGFIGMSVYKEDLNICLTIIWIFVLILFLATKKFIFFFAGLILMCFSEYKVHDCSRCSYRLSSVNAYIPCCC